MDQGQYVEIVGMSNAAHLRDVMLPRCERRMNEERALRAPQEAGAPRPRRSPLSRLGVCLTAAGERLLSRATVAGSPGASPR